jgi:hypothetical protein
VNNTTGWLVSCVLLISACGQQERPPNEIDSSMSQTSVASDRSPSGNRDSTRASQDPDELVSDLTLGQINDSRRFPLRRVFRLVWTRPASIDDEVLVQPADLMIAEGTLFLSDFSGSRVFALDLHSGQPRWSFGRAGSGPGEFRGRIGFAGRKQDTILLWNWPTRRLTRVAPSGVLVGSTNIEARATLTSLCVLADGTMLGNKFVRNEAAMIALISEDGGEVLRLDSLPWKELRTILPVAAQYTLHSLSDGTCLLATSYWAGAVRIGSDGSIRDSVAIVESVPRPSAVVRSVTVDGNLDAAPGSRRGISSRVTHPSVFTVLEVAELAQYIVLAFDGATNQKGHLLDFYHKATGGYAGSISTKGAIVTIAGSTNMLVIVTENESGLYQMNAFRLEHDRPSK